MGQLMIVNFERRLAGKKLKDRVKVKFQLTFNASFYQFFFFLLVKASFYQLLMPTILEVNDVVSAISILYAIILFKKKSLMIFDQIFHAPCIMTPITSSDSVSFKKLKNLFWIAEALLMYVSNLDNLCNKKNLFFKILKHKNDFSILDDITKQSYKLVT